MQLLKRLFKKDQSTASGAEAATASLSLASHIPEQYLAIWQLHKKRQLLEVKIQGSSRAYQSMILALDIERGLIWLDDLFPQQLLLETGDEVCIRHHRQGEQLIIRGPVIALGADYGASGFALVLPEHSGYLPRRASQRYSIQGEAPTLIKLRSLGQEPCVGSLQDISAGGLKVNVPGNLLGQLSHGATLPLLEFKLGDLHIRCRAKVCALRICRALQRCTQLSLAFADMPEQTQTSLRKLLASPAANSSLEFCAA